MKITHDNWKDVDFNVSSLWLIGPRAKGGKRENNYHGNFAPQIPNDLIQRFTDTGDVVLDMFMGSGTVLYECETLKRKYIGFDINDDIISHVISKMQDSDSTQFSIHNCDICNKDAVCSNIDFALNKYEKKAVDIVFCHPPYLDIVKFTDKEEDLSQISDVNTFNKRFLSSVQNVWSYLKKNGYFVLVVGDAYKESEVVPLGFYLMDSIKKNFKCKMKGIVIKDIVGNRGKLGTEAIYKFRALKFGYYIFKHEYIFVFRKE